MKSRVRTANVWAMSLMRFIASIAESFWRRLSIDTIDLCGDAAVRYVSAPLLAKK